MVGCAIVASWLVDPGGLRLASREGAWKKCRSGGTMRWQTSFPRSARRTERTDSTARVAASHWPTQARCSNCGTTWRTAFWQKKLVGSPYTSSSSNFCQNVHETLALVEFELGFTMLQELWLSEILEVGKVCVHRNDLLEPTAHFSSGRIGCGCEDRTRAEQVPCAVANGRR